MNWRHLSSLDDLNKAMELSQSTPIAIFKHSTRCSVSMMARRQVESSWDYSEDRVVPFFLDLIAHRDVSNAIAAETGVQHESPQLLLIVKNKTVHNASHSSINVGTLEQYI